MVRWQLSPKGRKTAVSSFVYSFMEDEPYEKKPILVEVWSVDPESHDMDGRFYKRERFGDPLKAMKFLLDNIELAKKSGIEEGEVWYHFIIKHDSFFISFRAFNAVLSFEITPEANMKLLEVLHEIKKKIDEVT